MSSPSQIPDADRLRRARRQFWLAAALFLGPFVAAFVIYHWFPQLLPAGRTNYGELIDPPRPLPALAFVDADGKPVASADLRRHWSLLYLAPAECDEACRERVHFSRQLWLALGGKRDKLRRLYVAPDADALKRAREVLAAGQPDLQWLAVDSPSAQALREFFQPRDAQALYLLDPLGNWIMRYRPAPGAEGRQRDFKGMQKDLKKLLML